MTTDAADAFDFYPCLVDGAPASIYVNLRFEHAAPIGGADTRYEVAIRMLEAGPHGIGTADEGVAANAIEEAVLARADALGLVYAGRLRHAGTWEVTLYGAADRLEAVRRIATAASAGRHVDVRRHPDADWRYYRELLLPDAERRQWMDDRRLVQILREHGDDARTPRRVDHHASFASAAARDAFVEAAAHAGFALARTSDAAGGDRPFGAEVQRTDAVELDHIHDVVMTLVDAAAAHGGHYERWTTSIERG